MIDRECEPWWDELEALVFDSQTLPGELELSLHRSDGTYELRPLKWSGDSSRAAREHLYGTLARAIRPLDTEPRTVAMGYLRDWAGREASARPTHSIMTSAQLRAIDMSRMVDVGAHTVNHPALAALTPERQREEICESKQTLEAILDRDVKGFSYPYGTWSSYTSRTREIVRAAGYSYACATWLAPCLDQQSRSSFRVNSFGTGTVPNFGGGFQSGCTCRSEEVVPCIRDRGYVGI